MGVRGRHKGKLNRIVELEKFVAQLFALGVGELVAPGAVFLTHHSARRGLLNLPFLRFHMSRLPLDCGEVNSTGQVKAARWCRGRASCAALETLQIGFILDDP